ncbi:MAG: hypothetical protein QNK37_00960 [Acidobacteriota bacterium]|nr:hypothetical protein [Acidobacteriota bacterium]
MTEKVRILSYVVTHDSGFAPNPFWGYCTLAACTPNHMGAKVVPDDWIVGWSNKATGNKLIFAMRITEILDFDDYFHDPRFKNKKPIIEGDLKERCGDNIYYRENNKWRKVRSVGHEHEDFIKKTQNTHGYSSAPSFITLGKMPKRFPILFMT